MNIQASDSNNRSTIITTFPAMAQSSQDVEELKALRKQVDLKKLSSNNSPNIFLQLLQV
ncbi:MAG: hypothetical protein HWD61_02685 [Parachlamydiaceae bacterium]|nr:MAG: hypothetical protein HWD61_02685 [Parachlamydiaceae bacterium]